MSMNQEPLSRRALRDAERAQSQVQDAPPPAPLTRRQLREQERAVEAQTLEQALPANASPMLGQIEVEPVVIEPVALESVQAQQGVATTAASEPWSLTDTGSIFTVSPLVGADNSTNSTSIVIQPQSDPLDVLGSGSGSITLPGVADVVGTLTGEITLIREAQEADLASALEASGSYQTDIPPMPAAGVIKGRSRERVFPKSVHTGRTQMYLVLSTIILIVAIGGLLGAAYMMGYFN